MHITFVTSFVNTSSHTISKLDNTGVRALNKSEKQQNVSTNITYICDYVWKVTLCTLTFYELDNFFACFCFS